MDTDSDGEVSFAELATFATALPPGAEEEESEGEEEEKEEEKVVYELKEDGDEGDEGEGEGDGDAGEEGEEGGREVLILCAQQREGFSAIRAAQRGGQVVELKTRFPKFDEMKYTSIVRASLCTSSGTRAFSIPPHFY